ncbi:MAG: alpha/beta hydrolase [Rhodothermia bacterium]
MSAGKTVTEMPGELIRHSNFESRFVESRNVDVWLPDDYDRLDPAGERSYKVVYLHDGQNLFRPSEAFAGVDWGIHETLSLLMGTGQIVDTIAVGIWNTPKRLLRYMPKRPFELVRDSEAAELFAELNEGAKPASDRYLDFIVTELRPFIEANYRVKTDAASSVIMGASMGALVSLYAVCEYPTVFGSAGCLSTSWTISGSPFIQYLEHDLPRPGAHKFYFDYGQEARIEGYKSFQEKATSLALGKGYRTDRDWMVRTFPDHDHSERSWRERVAIPLKFLLGRRSFPRTRESMDP